MENPSESFDSILLKVFGGNIFLKKYTLIAAGHANQALCLRTSWGSFFLKINQETDENLFREEALGLKLLAENTSLFVPEVYGFGQVDGINYLVTEWVREGVRSKDYWRVLGEGLAELHMATQVGFGLDHPNYISILPQPNEMHRDWTSFFIDERLEPMLQRAYFHQLITKEVLQKVRAIYPFLEGFFPSEKSSLLHGDLWTGNIMRTTRGEPVLIDPAVYYGHREMDLAFSRLFGGFSDEFYETYNDIFPLEPGFEERKDVYNLYPLLVHLNLFGTGYLPGILRVIERFY
ncbi:MAG: fructosamine kinase family protein [Lunatimonas sp.]|uniref:fructosamine kinase family protein n=1 Tax=Lunatimonas sp. TaxID=2060141 RepID=UPI00263AA63E|nr:fructosamine kinase family protein [Lunatimonas sp.]MCC5936699.1 fructosamine kinase family protein [Lunatimonas sp.]